MGLQLQHSAFALMLVLDDTGSKMKRRHAASITYRDRRRPADAAPGSPGTPPGIPDAGCAAGEDRVGMRLAYALPSSGSTSTSLRGAGRAHASFGGGGGPSGGCCTRSLKVVSRASRVGGDQAVSPAMSRMSTRSFGRVLSRPTSRICGCRRNLLRDVEEWQSGHADALRRLRR